MRKYLLAFWIACALIIPASTVRAAEANSPESNTICWKEAQCNEARKQLNPAATPGDNGWVHEQGDVCTGDWGRCLPVGESVTSIAIGGQSKFKDVGQYVQTIFSYAIGIAGILAVVVIITAGLRWVTSGGNTEAITSAKKMIGGAIMGAFLAFTSYFILNLLNPAFVNLRLPRTWMIRPINIVSNFCSQSPSSTLFAVAADFNNQDTDLTVTPNATFDLQYVGGKSDNSPFRCGNRLFTKDGGNSTCFGDICGKGKQCAPIPQGADSKSKMLMNCFPGQLVIHYSMNSLGEQFAQNIPFGGKLVQPNWFDASSDFWGVCRTINSNVLTIGSRNSWGSPGRRLDFPFENTSGGFNEYTISYFGFDEEKSWGCPADTELVGVVLKNELNGKWDWGYNPNLNIGMDQASGGIVAGSWKTVGARHYIPYDKLINEGIYADLSVSGDIISDVINNSGSKPTDGEKQ